MVKFTFNKSSFTLNIKRFNETQHFDGCFLDVTENTLISDGNWAVYFNTYYKKKAIVTQS